MRCYIVGMSGFLGRSLAERLALQGHHVTGCGSSDTIFVTEGIEFERVDLFEQPVVIPSGTDVVYYLAQSPYYKTFPLCADKLFAVNTFGVIKASEAAIKAGVKLFCFASTGNVYAPSFAPLVEDASVQRNDAYSLSKLMAEEGLDLFCGEMAVVSVRLFGLFGPGQQAMLPYSLYTSVINGKEIFIQPSMENPDDDGLQISFVFCPDVAKIFEKIALHSLAGSYLPKRINVGGESAISIKNFAGAIAETLGKEAKFVRGEGYREFDLIANIDLMRNLISPSFTSFDDAIQQSFSEK